MQQKVHMDAWFESWFTVSALTRPIKQKCSTAITYSYFSITFSHIKSLPSFATNHFLFVWWPHLLTSSTRLNVSHLQNCFYVRTIWNWFCVVCRYFSFDQFVYSRLILIYRVEHHRSSPKQESIKIKKQFILLTKFNLESDFLLQQEKF